MEKCLLTAAKNRKCMEAFDKLVDAVKEELAKKAPEIAAGIAKNLQKNVERAGANCTDSYTLMMMDLKLIDARGQVTDYGTGVYTELRPYFARSGKEREAEALKVSSEYTRLDDVEISKLLYDPDRLPQID